LNKAAASALLYIRGELGTLGDEEKEIAELPTRLEALQILISEHPLSPVEPVDYSNDPRVLEAKAGFLSRHGIASTGKSLMDTATEKGKRYLERLKAGQPERKASVEENELVKLVAAELNFKARAGGSEKYVFDDGNREQVRHLMYYFFHDTRCKWPLDKGLALIGSVGCGKTILFEAFSSLLARSFPESSRRFRVKSSREIIREFSSGQWAATETYLQGSLCIDDVGDESTEFKHYGNATPVIEEILKDRYESYRKGGKDLTHITSNLSLNEMSDRYGLRAMDRLGQMMTFVTISGSSRRPK